MKKIYSRVCLVLCGALLALMLLGGLRAEAQLDPPLTVVVNSFADSSDINPGDELCDVDGSTPGEQCTLRAAVQETNAYAVAGHDTIFFDPSLNLGTISLNTALPPIASNLVMAGPGASLLRIQRSTAGGTPNFRIFQTSPGVGPPVTVTISGLTLSNGKAPNDDFGNSGGAILNLGTLTVDSCVISGNEALIGGGIYNTRVLEIVRTTIANNTATDAGGGLANSSQDVPKSLTIDSSTISNNISGTQGGGILNSGTSLSIISNTTISSNSAVQGAGISNLDNLHLDAVTITANDASSNSGGIRNGGVIVFKNTILAGNTSPAGPDGVGLNFASLDYNLIGNTNGMEISGGPHDITGVNPRLGPLADNGGLTRTHELLDGSPAIDAGGLTASAMDQRGFPRLIDNPAVANAAGGDATDIGAYETPIYEVNSTADTNDGACTLKGTGNGCTLREAISAANSAAGAEVITFQTSLTTSGPATITLSSELPALGSDMTIAGPGANLLTVQRSTADGTPSFRIFTIHSPYSVQLSDLTISNGNASGQTNGGGVRNNGALTMRNCNVYGNSAGSAGISGLGAGIYSESGSVTLIDCNIGGVGPGQANTSGATGGGIFIESGALSMTRGAIVGNTGDGLATRGIVTLNSVTIASNIETGNGGAGVFVLGGHTKIFDSLIANNIANGGDGGGIRSGLGLTTVINSTISGNRSIGAGGGVYNFNGQIRLFNVTVTNNRSDSDGNTFQHNGGGTSGAVLLQNSIVAGNSRGSDASPVANDAGHAYDPSSSFNLIGVCDGCGLINGGNNNQLGVGDPGLSPLADNGGPTLTHALLPASPALDAGSNALVTNGTFDLPPFSDQRGESFSRIVDGPDGDATATVDIGAFEQQVTLSDIADVTGNEDTELVIPFYIGDRSAITSITATSSNTNLVPNSTNHLRLTEAGSTELIVVKPATDLVGTTEITVTVNTTGGSTNATFVVTINPVNDAPSFERRLSASSIEDFGLITFANFATNLSAGPADEASQSLTFEVTNNTNPSLFESGPAISPDGTLSYTSALNANGSATVTVVVNDSGGTANGGQDTSQPRSFIITVTPINDSPVNLIPSMVSVIENSVLTFSAANSNQISTSDVDAGNALVEVALTVNNGLLTLGSTTGLTFTQGDGVSDSTMTFKATIPTINTALNGMTYTPNHGFSGFATFQITTDDLGNSGLGAAFPDNDFLNIHVVDGGALQFASSLNFAPEDVSNATIVVARVGGFAGTTSVSFVTANGTATGGDSCGPGIDYISTSGTLSWVNDDTAAKTFQITVCNDSENEEDETINLAASAATGSGQLGTPVTATLTITNNDAPVLMTESGQSAVALDAVIQTRDPFSLTNLFNFSNDQRRRVSFFVWRLGLLSTDTSANLTVVAEDNEGRTYPLTVEHVGFMVIPSDVVQLIVILPDNVVGAPRDLWVKVQLRGPASNKGFIKIAAP